MKYDVLVKILDQIRNEASSAYRKKYASDCPNTDENLEKINQARSRAYIHLFLKVSFGIESFDDREHYITDGSYDGGIDGYYINEDNKCIYLLQSKFRTTSTNFEEKEIAYDELLAMDVDRILSGESTDDNGNEYAGKIKQLQREISELSDIARYTYKIIIIANTKTEYNKLKRLCSGYPIEVFNSEKCYSQLVFPVIKGTYYNESDLTINIDLSNKNAGSKISYSVSTASGPCDITVLFVPTLEIAKMMDKYRNSILKYNPRSYLTHDGSSIHNAIRDTLINKNTNEFAIFNNGITMLSDETQINEQIGQKNKAKLLIKNPQIINGGQTCFTLSRIYQEYKNSNYEDIFQEKEVLLKIITLHENFENDSKQSEGKKLELIESISNATNRQTPVINADKNSNEKIHIDLQKVLFDKYGILYERKRGEFEDGLYNNYINESQIIERNYLLRIYMAVSGDLQKAKTKKLFQNYTIPSSILTDEEILSKINIGLKVFSKSMNKNKYQKLNIEDYLTVFVYTNYLYHNKLDLNKYDEYLSDMESDFSSFKEYVNSHRVIKSKRSKINKKTNIPVERIKYFPIDYQKLYKDYISSK